MKILFVSAARAWTAEIDQSVFVARALQARGHTCRWMAPPGAESLPRAGSRGLDCRAFPEDDFKHHPWKLLRNLLALRGELQAFAPEVVFTVESPAHLVAALAGAGAGAARRTPRLVRWRGSALPLRGGALSRRLYDRGTWRVLSPCRHIVEQARCAGYRTDSWRVVDGSVDLARFTPSPPDPADWAEAGFEPGTPLAVLVARLAPVKGVDVFLEAMALLRANGLPGLGALVIGEAWEGQQERFEAEVRRLHLEGAVRWLGRREDVPRWIRLARVGVVSSTGSEMHSRAALEYMACARPVAATRVGVLPEWLEGRAFARLARPGDAAALAGAIQALVEAPDWPQLTAQARREAEERFAPERMVDRIEALLRGCEPALERSSCTR